MRRDLTDLVQELFIDVIERGVERADERLLLALAGLEAALPTSHRVSAVRAELLIRAGRRDDAVEAYLRAIDLCGNEAERRHLRARLEDAERVGPPA